MYKFDVYFRNIVFINYFEFLKKVYKLRCWCHSLNTKIIKKFQQTLQKDAGCFMYSCDVISCVAL